MKIISSIIVISLIHKACGVSHHAFIKTREQWDEIKNEQNKIKYENNIKIQHFPNIHIKKKEKDYFYYLCNIRWHRVLFVLLAFLIFL
tara:strand:+ start:100 stop:363 length:264 start_codon:yes stop_codon:yes gene_type:complete